MKNSGKLIMPKVVHLGTEAIDQLENILDESINKIIIFTDEGIKNTGLLDLPIKIIEKLSIEYDVIADIPTEPSYQEAQAVVDQFNQLGGDFIIGMGGGSVMDVAKLASVLTHGEYTVKDLLDDPSIARKSVNSLMIPTTAGTGSEATPNSIVLVPEDDLKVGIVNEALIADYVLLDPRTTENLPKSIAATTGVDALCHAIECFTSTKANPISDTFALRALDLIMNNIIEACTNPEAIEAKSNMLLGSFLAGVAITTSGTTGVHALSYPLGGKYHIAHGVSNAMLLVPVMKFNEPEISGLLADVYDYVVKPADSQLTQEEKSNYIIEELERIVDVLEIPTDLTDYNVTEEDLDGLVEAGMQVTRLLVNNMREITPEDARKIYQEII